MFVAQKSKFLVTFERLKLNIENATPPQTTPKMSGINYTYKLTSSEEIVPNKDQIARKQCYTYIEHCDQIYAQPVAVAHLNCRAGFPRQSCCGSP